MGKSGSAPVYIKSINKINKYILFHQRGHIDSDMSYENIITSAKINQIRLIKRTIRDTNNTT